MRLDRCLASSLVLVALFASPPSAGAANPLTVGNGTAASCTETALQFALAFAAIHGGGTIKFNCGRAPVIITLTDTLTIPNNTTIDGGGLITLSRSSTSLVEDLILVDHSSTAILKSLAFNRAGNTAGFALFSEGTLTIKDSTFSENFVTVLNEGTLTVISTTFSDNGSFVAVGAIWNKGTLHVKNSLFSHNVAGSGGGILSDGTLSVENSTFVQNEGDGGFGSGGAIVNAFGTATIKTSWFSRNDAAAGGAIANFAALTVKNTVFDGIGAGPSNIVNAMAGGGIFNGGEATVSNSLFVGNVASIFGGAVFNHGALSVSNSTITGNTAGVDGGGIYTCVAGDPAFFCFDVGSLELKTPS